MTNISQFAPKRHIRTLRAHALRIALLSSICTMSAVARADLGAGDVLGLSLEQLSNIEVTSVSKSPEKASEAAAAIFVITPDDIRRIGATSIPEALRIVPGLNVAQAGAHQWAVSSRGFNGQFANKLLVLIDGRVVYTPLFNGVWWDVQDVMLEDIDRIEVIRGPGATLWGANAVNGVINIITKRSSDTQGGLASITSGTQQHAITSVREGVKLGDDAYLRVYAKYSDLDSLKTMGGQSAGDAWRKYQGGFRADWKQGESQDFTLQGDLYTLDERLPWNLPSITTPPSAFSDQTKHPNGGNILGRWNYAVADDSHITLQMYYDRAVRDNVARVYTNTYDVDFQHVWTGASRQEITWGLGYRLIDESLDNTLFYSALPDNRNDSFYSGFLQDKIALWTDKVFLTLGSKLEHNPYSGMEYEPSVKLSWLVDSKQTLWSSVSRAVKTPYRGTSDGSLLFAAMPTGTVPAAAAAGTMGNPKLDSERLIAYELGYRVQPVKTVSLDASAFYNQYDNLIRGIVGTTTVLTGPGGVPYYFTPVIPYNDNSATSHGIELSANWEVTNTWRLSGGYSYLHLDIDKPDPGFSTAGTSPEQQFNIRSTLALPYNIEMDNAIYYVDPLQGLNIDGYYRFDTRLSWKAMENVELSLVGQNLLDSRHPEYVGFVYQATEQVPRTVFANVTFRF